MQCTQCKKHCASEELDCYVLDNNGFIILSESSDHTGKFFGQIDGTIMDSLVQDRIYKKVAVYDYQGACSDQKNPFSDDATRLSVSINHLYNFFFLPKSVIQITADFISEFLELQITNKSNDQGLHQEICSGSILFDNDL